jgi:hypothetical protein
MSKKMIITDPHLDQIVHAVNGQLNLAGIDLHPTLLQSLNDTINTFLTDECQVFTKENVSFDDLEEDQWVTWMDFARGLRGKKGVEQSSEATESQARALFQLHDGITTPLANGASLTSTTISKNIYHQPFSLFDLGEPSNSDATGYVDFSSTDGLSIRFNGYGDDSGDDHSATPIYIEWYEGDLRVLLYADVNKDEPTHVVSMAGAHNNAKIDTDE